NNSVPGDTKSPPGRFPMGTKNPTPPLKPGILDKYNVNKQENDFLFVSRPFMSISSRTTFRKYLPHALRKTRGKESYFRRLDQRFSTCGTRRPRGTRRTIWGTRNQSRSNYASSSSSEATAFYGASVAMRAQFEVLNFRVTSVRYCFLSQNGQVVEMWESASRTEIRTTDLAAMEITVDHQDDNHEV
ncbi:hypothetical protein AVEN_186740-1, partial [Araneus ventricosus]